MARQHLDITLNEDLGRMIAKVNEMLTELYAAGGVATDPSVTTLTATGLVTGGALTVDTGTKTASATAGAATLNKDAGVITSEALTTAAAAVYTLTITNSSIAATDQVFASVYNGTNTQGVPIVTTVAPGSGSVVIKILNNHATDAFNGTIKVAFVVLKN
jgi:hypothetical protein